MILLALDTALEAAQAAVLDGDRILASLSEPMSRGHQERLAPLVEQTMREAGIGFERLNRIAVTVGPGSFTGLRVGLAFAKGLMVALDRPCLGLGSLEALAASGPKGALIAAVIEGPRETVYLQAFRDGEAMTAPDVMGLPEAAALLADLWDGGPLSIIGPGAPRLAGVIAGAEIDPRPVCDIEALARLAAARPEPRHAPAPLYLRPPDAKTLAERGLPERR